MNKRIKNIRDSLGLSQKEFGAKLGCSRDRIANVELGRVVPDDLFIQHLCSVYGVNEDWLRFGKGEPDLGLSDDLDYLVGFYGDSLSPNIKELICILLKMPEEKRKLFEEFLDEYHKLRKTPDETK